MNNELFDRMMKDNLNKVNVSPSQGLKKSIGKKLFFQNILNFHKVKVVVATLFMGTAGVLSYGYFNTASSEKLSVKEYQASNETIERIENLNVEVIESLEISKTNTNNSTPTEISDNQISSGGIQENTEDVSSEKENSIASNNVPNKFSTNSNESNDSNESVDDFVEKSSNENVNFVDNEELAADGLEVIICATELSIDQYQASMYHVDPRPIGFDTDYITTPSTVVEKDISFKNKPMIRKEFSVDVYKSVMATNDVDNTLKSVEHQEFNWDFYVENESLKTTNLGGIDVNYAIGTKTIKGKVSLGFNASQVVEQKPIYEFDEITDPVWLEVFEVDELAWINTYGEDTCTQCFSTSNTPELQDELKKDNNVYKYVSVPLRLGAEVNLKYVSLDVMGGMQWNHLTSASGIYVNRKTPEHRELYYWNDMEVSAMDKDNDMLKRNYFSWTASANLRVRITRQFDLMAGYDMVYSKGDITKDHYIMDKTLKYSQAKIGITFYPNRLPLLKK